MRRNICGIFAVAGGYAAAVIGAGFASGQEVISFFVRYGKCGFVGIIVACAVFALFAAAILCYCVEHKIRSYSVFLERIFPNKILRRAAECMVFLCSAASMCVMTACAGETARMLYGAPVIVGSVIFTVICGMIFLMEAREIMGTNAVMGAVITVGIIFSCLYILRYREHQTISQQTAAVVSGLTYAGYNIIGTGALLAGMSRFLKSKGDAVIASVVSGVALFIMITLLWGVLGIYYGKINLGEIPMLTMTFRQNNALGVFYGVMLITAILTTGISNGFALIDLLGKRMTAKKATAFVLFFTFCMSGAGFSVLISTVYVAFGYIGAVIAALVVYKSITAKK